MKKQFLMIATATLLASPLFAQLLEINAKGSGKSTWILNKNISDAGADQDSDLGWGYNYGGGLTFYFTKSLGVGADVMFNQYNAAFKGTFGAPLNFSYTSKITLNTLDIPVMFKIKGEESGGFLELGAQYSMFNSINYHSSIGGINSDRDVKDKFTSSGIEGLLGLGLNIDLNDRLVIQAGLRFEYGLTDIKGVDGLGRNLSDNLMYPLVYSKYQPSHLAAAGFFLGMAYSIGHITKSPG